MKRLSCVFLLAVASVAQAVCTPAKINFAAVESIRPHMTPAAVSAVLGCLPTDIGPVGGKADLWIWGLPLVADMATKTQVAVVFDEQGVLSAHFQIISPLTRPAGNSRIRVEPPVKTYGNWVPGVVTQ